MTRSINPVPQFSDAAGDPYAGGLMFYFDSGTSDQKDTFADAALSIINEHPVELDGAGRLPNVFFNGSARQVLASSNGIQVWERDPVTGAGGGGGIPDYNALEIYSENDLVLATDGNYYRSLQNANQDNDPLTSASFWNQAEFLELWNTNITYAVGDNVKTTNGILYRGLTASNTGNDPATSPVQWRSLDNDIANWDILRTYSANEPVLRNGKVYRSKAGSNLGNDPETNPDDWLALHPDTLAHVTGATTSDGFGIASVSNSGAGIQNVTFDNSATSTEEQVITVSLGGTSSVTAMVEKTGVNTCTIRTFLSDSATPLNEFPIEINRWLI